MRYESSRSRRTAPSTTSSGMLQRLDAGDERAWERFVHKYHVWILRYCRRQGMPRSDAEDAAAEIVSKAWRKLSQFQRSAKYDFRKWLRTVTSNTIADYYRRREKEQAAGEGAALPRASDLPALTSGKDADRGAQLPVALRRAIKIVRQNVNTTTWSAFFETYVNGRDAADVASELGISKQSVWKARQRVVKRIRKLLDEAIPEGEDASQ